MKKPTKKQIEKWLKEAPEDSPHKYIAEQAYMAGLYERNKSPEVIQQEKKIRKGIVDSAFKPLDSSYLKCPSCKALCKHTEHGFEGTDTHRRVCKNCGFTTELRGFWG